MRESGREEVAPVRPAADEPSPACQCCRMPLSNEWPRPRGSVLRNPAHKRLTFNDLKAVRARYDSLDGKR